MRSAIVKIFYSNVVLNLISVYQNIWCFKATLQPIIGVKINTLCASPERFAKNNKN